MISSTTLRYARSLGQTLQPFATRPFQFLLCNQNVSFRRASVSMIPEPTRFASQEVSPRPPQTRVWAPNRAYTLTKIVCVLWAGLLGCKKSELPTKRFSARDSQQTGITFTNRLTESDTLNYFNFPYIYMGGGVAVLDVNQDDLPDLYFTGNMVDNHLYLNKGNLVFEEISTQAGVNGDQRWYTGATAVDINLDGYDDLYVCVSGPNDESRNQLFINNGDQTFTEQAEAYGLADNGKSIQASFLDYDNDGDLDVYVANYPLTPFSTPQHVYRHYMDQLDPKKSDKLYRNEGDGRFVDVTKQAGLLNFGLSVSAMVADYNGDGWQDLYVSNDFSTPDYFYLNNQDGTFSEVLKEATRQTAFYGMGTDAADINNDGRIDLIQVDMAAEDNRRSKANMASMNPALFWSTVNYGFHYQYMYNALQLNRGTVNGVPQFSNVAWDMQVATTDWSWSPLLADFDNDGLKDLFISNGTRREINNKDFFNALEVDVNAISGKEQVALVNQLPEEPVDNYFFRQVNGRFEKVNQEWGVSLPGFSNGGIYVDLDNDGDLEIVLNNLDSEASLFENHTQAFPQSHYLTVDLSGPKNNPEGIGAKVDVYSDGHHQSVQVMKTRGFQSAGQAQVHVGLGSAEQVDSLIVIWPGGEVSRYRGLGVDQTFIAKADDSRPSTPSMAMSPIFGDSILWDKAFDHQENAFDDFRFQVLLPHKMSNFGPALAVGDVNQDGREDVFIGGAAGQAGSIYVQDSAGMLRLSDAFQEAYPAHEDMDAVFFDADGDTDLDLYIVSGGNEYPKGAPAYQDRLYLNDEGAFALATDALPELKASGSCVRPHDIDGDGDLDLFVGGRLSPRDYPNSGKSFLLINESEKGKLAFSDQTETWAPGLSQIGMVTDATWVDLNQDDAEDLVVVGEWMPVTVFSKKSGSLVLSDASPKGTEGWWFSVAHADLDQDGDQDLVLGNLGTNYKYQASPEEPFNLYVYDFDQNGKDDLVLGYVKDGTQFPVRGRECSSQQIPTIKVAFENYETFAKADLPGIYGRDLEDARHFRVEDFSSVVWLNEQSNFKEMPLPQAAQWSPINDMLIDDYTGDGQLDLLVAGNLFAAEVETPRNDAGLGLLLAGLGDGRFEVLSGEQSGLMAPFDTKALAAIRVAGKRGILMANNNGPLMGIRVR